MFVKPKIFPSKTSFIFKTYVDNFSKLIYNLNANLDIQVSTFTKWFFRLFLYFFFINIFVKISGSIENFGTLLVHKEVVERGCRIFVSFMFS
jgi:hypothetical protein